MQKEIIITPEELYYLGRFLQAKYIDYAYVAALNDIGQNFSLFESETKAALVSAGILVEDFGGNVEIDKNISAILKPIFFGEVETSLDICSLGEENTVTVYKFHFHDGIVTMVTGNNGKLLIKPIDQIGIKNIVEGLLTENYNAVSGVRVEISEKTVARFVAAKSISVGKTSAVKTFLETDGVFYQEDDECVKSMSKDMFVNDIFNIIKGG